MKDLQAMLEEAIRNGKTVEDLYGMANAAQNTIITEQEREDRVAAARKKAAEAMCEYMNALEPKSTKSFQRLCLWDFCRAWSSFFRQSVCAVFLRTR